MKTPAEIDSAILDKIAAEDGIERDTMSFGTKDAVFFRRGDELLIWGQKGSLAWLEIRASIIMSHAVERAARR